MVGRQSIVDQNCHIVGYEILYRGDSFKTTANITSNISATANVLINLFTNIGIEKIVGKKLAFINVDDSILLSKFSIEKIVPPDKVIFEILENTKVSKELIEKIKHMKKQGFIFALDDFNLSLETINLIDYVNYIKVDVLNTDEKEILKIVQMAKEKNIKLLAEKVENREIFEKLKQVGFDYFQGYFFSKPENIVENKLSPGKIILLNVLQELGKENVNIEKVENLIKKDTKLALNLLRFINSAHFYLKVKVKSIKHAIQLIGIDNLKAWLLLFMYANEFNERIDDNPAFDLALVRAKFMEEIINKIKKSEAGKAYLTGLLSMVDTVLGISKKDFFEKLQTENEIKDAVLNYQGVLGELLFTIEEYEKEHFKQVEQIISKYNLTLNDLFQAEYNAIQYVEETKKEINSVV